MNKIFLTILCYISVLNANAQLDNSFFYTKQTFQDSLSNSKINLNIELLNYARNSEIKSQTDKGVTWIGVQAWPQANYHFNKKITMAVGFLLRKDFGNDDFFKPVPTYNIKFNHKNHRFIFGTLEGALEHQLIEPLYFFENIIDKRIENGIQVKRMDNSTKALKFTYDAWIDWQKTTYRNATHQEVFLLGVNSNLKLKNSNSFKINMPFQFTVKHIGGEIYKLPHPNISSQLNTALGLKIDIYPKDKKIKSYGIQLYSSSYMDASPNKRDSFWDGTGFYATAQIQFKRLQLMLNYWDAHQYISPIGDRLYASLSDYENPKIFNYRELAFIRASYQINLHPQIELLARANFSYDFSTKSINNLTEIYTRIFIYKPIK